MDRAYYILLFAAIALGAACGSQSVANDSNRSVANNMGHNMNGMSSNSMGNMNRGDMDHSAMKSSPNAASAPYDLQFIDTMSMHHQAAISMAELAGTRAEHPELKDLAKAIIAAQQKEIGDMGAWRGKWFAGAAPAMNMDMSGMTGSMKGMDTDKLSSLSGNAFDLEFIAQMIPHHEGAVTMAKEALQKSQKNEIKALANAIIKSQSEEITKMQAWNKAWNKMSH
jgi:uncharacterized protein (DUF305 family)